MRDSLCSVMLIMWNMFEGVLPGSTLCTMLFGWMLEGGMLNWAPAAGCWVTGDWTYVLKLLSAEIR